MLPLVLIILDGWGIDSPNKGNAITLAKTPNVDNYLKKYPNTLLCAHGRCVGLPDSQDGNSESGHMNIGAGRIVEQDSVRISRSINQGSFFKNPALVEAVRHVKKNNSNLHLMGMVSNGMSAHSDPDHLLALLIMAKKENVKNIYLHIFTDGRDSPKYASLNIVQKLKSQFRNGELIATVMGRFYAMDRKKKWERTEMAYNALVLGEGRRGDSSIQAITESYNRNESDEFISPYVIYKEGKMVPRINNNDAVMFFNLRSDRARQLAKIFVQKEYDKQNPGAKKRKKTLKNLRFVAMTDFGPDLDNIISAFPSSNINNTLPMLIFKYRQLYIAESEKYAHISYFFNGGYAGKINGEKTLAIDSPDVISYDSSPIMKTKELSRAVVNYLKNDKYDFITLNIAAPDMIGHTGNLEAGIICCEGVDREVGKIVDQCLAKNGTVIITADHGNIEEMINLKTGEIDTEHSSNPVPFILINKKLNKVKLRRKGILGDIVPTILDLIGVDKPIEMTGRSIIQNYE